PASTATFPVQWRKRPRHPEGGADACVALVWVLYRVAVTIPVRFAMPWREMRRLQPAKPSNCSRYAGDAASHRIRSGCAA
ncbi:hypothetical protein BUY60_21750, partial [Staphylococcus epidermidis]